MAAAGERASLASFASVSSSAGGETEPLVKPPFNDHNLFQVSPYINANSPWYILLSTIGLCFVNFTAVIGAYFFVLASHRNFSPRCYEYSLVHEVVCDFSTLAVWTYPLICLLMVVFVCGKTMLDSRLYYECLMHGIMLDFDVKSFNHPVVYILVVWGLCTPWHLFYLNSETTMLQRVCGMFAYYFPILSFYALFAMSWSVKSSLLPLPKFQETEPNYAAAVFAEAAKTFVPEPHFRVAFENVSDDLQAQEQHGPLGSSAFFALIAKEAVAETTRAWDQEREEGDLDVVPGYLDRFIGYVATMAGFKKRAQYQSGIGRVSRPEVLSVRYNLFKPYWVYRVLFHKRLDDGRSRQFWHHALVYLGFFCFVVLAFLLLMTVTVLTFLVFEHLIPSDWPLVNYFHLTDENALGVKGAGVGRAQDAASSVASAREEPGSAFMHSDTRRSSAFGGLLPVSMPLLMWWNPNGV